MESTKRDIDTPTSESNKDTKDIYTTAIEPAGDEKHAAADALPDRDGVFGELDDDAKEYRSLTAWGAFMIMTKANLGVGVLAIPGVFHSVGLVPGYVLIIGLCAMMTCKWRVDTRGRRRADPRPKSRSATSAPLSAATPNATR